MVNKLSPTDVRENLLFIFADVSCDKQYIRKHYFFGRHLDNDYYVNHMPKFLKVNANVLIVLGRFKFA